MTSDRTPIVLDDTAPQSHRDLAGVILALDDQRQALRRTGNLEILAAGAVATRELVAALRQLLDDTKGDVVELMSEREEQRLIVGNHVVERGKTNPTYHFDSDELLRRVIVAALAEHYADGIPEQVMEAAGVVVDALRDVLPLTASGIKWKMGSSQNRGLRDYLEHEQIKEHRHVARESRPTVSIR